MSKAISSFTDPRFLGRGGKPKSKESISQIRLTDKVIASFEPDRIQNQRVEFIGEGTDWSYLKFDLPMPPSLNQWVRTWNGVAHKSECSVKYGELVGDFLKSRNVRATICKVYIELLLFGLPEGSDTDNRTKQIFDALQGLLVHNDYQIRKQSAEDMETMEYGSFVRLIIRRRGGFDGLERARAEMESEMRPCISCGSLTRSPSECEDCLLLDSDTHDLLDDSEDEL